MSEENNTERKIAGESIDLDYPVQHDGKELAEVFMRRPKVRDRLFAKEKSKNDVQMEAMLIGNLCNLPPEVLAEVDLADYRKMADVLEAFFGLAEKT